MPDLTDTDLDQLIQAIGLTGDVAAAAPAAADPYAGVRALAARHDQAYGAVLGHRLGQPRRPYQRGAA
jgi:ribosomal protein L12E/L44/L45/RPP1/RPP2